MATSDEDIDYAELLEAGDDTPRRRGPRKSRFDERTLENWMKLQHALNRPCEVPLHESITERPRNKGLSVIIDDVAVCRICFLHSADKEL